MVKWLRFVGVGGVGFIVDTLMVTLLIAMFELPLVATRVVAFVFAASVTWIGNRLVTFSTSASGEPVLKEWGKYLLCSALGAIPNISVFLLIANKLNNGMFSVYVALACGVLVGMVCNYLFYSRWVFTKTVN